MMAEDTLQLIIRHFNELKADIQGVKTDISAVTTGQEEHENDVSAVENDMKTEISAMKNDMKTEISTSKTASVL
jgi:hypothetical protein